MISEVLICSRTISLYSQCSQVVLPKKHLKVPSSADLISDIFGYFLSPQGPIALPPVDPFVRQKNLDHL